MMPSTCALRALVDRHFSGSIRPTDERQLREHLPSCTPCRDHYERHLLLARLEPGALDARTRLGRGLGVEVREERPSWRPALAVLAMACVALLMVRVPWRDASSPGEFTPRGSGQAEASRLMVYAVGANGVPAPVGEALDARQELAFAYRNPDARRYLLVFGVDEAGRVYWYHPSWTDPGDNPQALPIHPGDAPWELPEAISQPLAAGRLTVHGVFLDEPMTVRELEAGLAAAGDGGVGEALPPGADVTSLELHVLP